MNARLIFSLVLALAPCGCGSSENVDAAARDGGGDDPLHAFVGDSGGNHCDPSAQDQAGCSCRGVGVSRACFTGPSTTRGVGACADGIQACLGQEFGIYGDCAGDKTPGPETCSSTTDTNCNGKIGCGDPAACPNGCGAGSRPSVRHTLAAGGAMTCAITAVGGVKCWGKNEEGELGSGVSRGDAGLGFPPVDVVGLASGVIDITAGGEWDYPHACALTQTGAVKCWDDGDDSINNPIPVDVPGLGSGGSQIASGMCHTCALLTAGGVACWGYGCLGAYVEPNDATFMKSNTPTMVPGLGRDVTNIASGDGFSCALLAGGSMKCWGA